MQSAISHRICKECSHKLSQMRFPKANGRMFHSGRKKWRSKEVRFSFLDYFCTTNGHKYVKSSSVIPGKDQGTYFTNAGMNQFKPIFLGTCHAGSDMANYTRVTNSQKCIRIGGKHNDLDDVGSDLTHHTFFEMLGSWSFGDYFKKEACSMALDLLLNVYKLPLDRLYFTYFGGDTALGLQPDLECREIWRELGVPEERILPFGMRDNFWDMGDTGPCGPCTEIHYDHVGSRNASCLVNMDSPEVVEIWNLVFMQYNRQTDGTLLTLPKTHVDTGMGLERLCAVLRGSTSSYNTDLFKPLFACIKQRTEAHSYSGEVGTSDVDGIDTAYRILADHTRMATVCISDGLLPGRQDLEHKLRSVIYRALYQCHEVLHASQRTIETLVSPVVDSLGDAFPEITVNSQKVKEVLNSTEHRYLLSNKEGIRNFERLLRKNPEITALSGEDILRLKEGHYGDNMSLDMIELLAKSHNIQVNPADIHDVLEQHKASSMHVVEVEYPWLTAQALNDLSSNSVPVTNDEAKYQYTKSKRKYEFANLSSSRVVCLLNKDNNIVPTVSAVGDKVGILLDKTQFYAEKGGQEGDKGYIKTETGLVVVTDTQSNDEYVLHIGTITDGYIETSQPVTMGIDEEHRLGCMRNHTATHLVNSALRQVLGSDVCQRGSSVVQDKLTFEFSCVAAVTNKNIRKIEHLVKGTIEQKLPLDRQLKPLQEALSTEGVISLENVLYPNEVYVVSYNSPVEDSASTSLMENSVGTSVELCGGTHVLNTGDIGPFCITSLSNVSSGTKTIVCVTGDVAKKANETSDALQRLCKDLELSIAENNQDIKQCTGLQKQIYQILGKDVVPKIVKDKLTIKMDNIGLEINKVINQNAFTQLKQDLKEKMADDSEFIVQHFTIKVLQKTNKLIKSLSVEKPMILVVDTSNNTVAYLTLPQIFLDEEVFSLRCLVKLAPDWEKMLKFFSSPGRSPRRAIAMTPASPVAASSIDTQDAKDRQQVVESFRTAVNGRISQSETTYDVVSLKGKHTKLFIETANKTLIDYSEKKKKTAHL